MKLFAAVFALCMVALASSAAFQDKTEDDFFKASAACAEKLKIPASLLEKLQQFEYPDEELVHEDIKCVFSTLELFNDKTGYNVEHVADLYKDKANAEELIPILSNCNKNPTNEPAAKWAYKGFQCIMASKVGQWFKDDITKQAAAKA
uniref:OBP11 n=2 Tax=Eupeodes corollae TaxID=290404 RepID=A0A8F9RZH8_9MUSC|nr:OBP11 [Eupeodes corollae]